MRKPAFEPFGYAKTLEKTGLFGADNSFVYEWTGTHWTPLDDIESERRALRWIVDSGSGSPTAANARAAHQTALRWLAKVASIDERTVIPVTNGYLHLEDGRLVLREHEKSLGLRHVLACNYDPLAPEPREFLAFILSR